MTATKTWPFGNDADRDDPLTAHRIAVTSSHPGWYYLVAFDRQSEDRPDERETAMLASFLDEYKTRWYSDSGAHMAELGLDVDGGANGVIFHKWGPDDWGYRRQSYTMGLLWSVPGPGLRGTSHAPEGAEALSLAALMARIHGFGDEPNPRWEAWKAAHPEVFGQ